MLFLHANMFVVLEPQPDGQFITLCVHVVRPGHLLHFSVSAEK